MTSNGSRTGTEFRTLLTLDARRAAGGIRHPAAGPVIALLLPIALLAGVVWMVGVTAEPAVADLEGSILFGLLVSAPLSFSAYGWMFRAGDQPFVRRLGISSHALFAERALRFLLFALAVAALAMLPFIAAGQSLARPAAIALGSAIAAWGGGLLSTTLSARALARRGRRGWGLLAIGIWDAEVAAIAPLLYAPLIPYAAGTVAAGVVGAGAGAAWVRVLVMMVLALLIWWLARAWYAEALPRFAPRALEMGFEPPPGGAGEMSVGRGAGRLLPRPAAAVWVRDTVVVNRRYTWASRVVWPVTIVAFIALARWGQHPATRTWVAAAALMTLLVQTVAAIGVGRLERTGRRWLDRSLGLAWPHRLLGRWAWAFGASLWLTIPIALAWSWWTGLGGGWAWVMAGAFTALAGAMSSLAVAGWR